MKKLYLRHSINRESATVVLDDHETKRFLLVGKWGTHLDTLTVYDIRGIQLAQAKQETTGLLPNFIITKDGQQVARLGKSLGFIREIIHVDGVGWLIFGNLLNGTYHITRGLHKIARIIPIPSSKGVYNEITFVDDLDQVTLILVVAILDRVIYYRKRRTAWIPLNGLTPKLSRNVTAKPISNSKS